MNTHLTNTLHQQVTPEKLTAFDTALAAAEHAFEFLVGLSPQERQRLRPFGPMNEAFVPDIIEAAERNVALVPPQLSAAEIAARREATVELAKRALRLADFQQRVEDTSRLAGDGCVGLVYDLYHILKRMGMTDGLDATVARLQRRFARNAGKPNAGGSSGGSGSGSAGGAGSSGGAGSAGGSGTAGGSGSSGAGGSNAGGSGASQSAAATPAAGAGSNIVALPNAANASTAGSAPSVAA